MSSADQMAAKNGGPTYQCGQGASNFGTSILQAGLGIVGLGNLMNPYDSSSSQQLSQLKSQISSLSNAISLRAAQDTTELNQPMLTLITEMNALTEQTVTLDRQYTKLNLKESSMYVVTIISSVIIIAIFFIITK